MLPSFRARVKVETKVSAVSRKTNTTTHEVLGVLTKGDTQIVCSLIASLVIASSYL